MLATVDLLGGLVDADLDTLATARYVTIDELLQRAPQLAPWRPTVGMAPKLSDAELVTLAVMQALLGFSSQACWLRYADRHLRHLFAYLPGQAGDTKRLVGRRCCYSTPSGRSPPTPACGPTMSGWSTPPAGVRPLPGDHQAVGAGRLGPIWLLRQPFALRRGLRLQLVGTLHGLAIRFALTGAKADERQVLVDLLGVEPELVAARGGRRCWPTSTPPAAAWSGSWPGWACDGWGRPARASRRGLAQTCSNRCGS